MRRHLRTGAHILLALVLLSPISCIGARGVNLFPDSKNIELGKQIGEEIRKPAQEYPILSGYPEVKVYVEGSGARFSRLRTSKKEACMHINLR